MGAHKRRRQAVSRQRLVYSLQDDSQPNRATASSRHVSGGIGGPMHSLAWRRVNISRYGPVSWYWKLRSGCKKLRSCALYWVRNRSRVLGGSLGKSWIQCDARNGESGVEGA